MKYELYDIVIFNIKGEMTVDTITSLHTNEYINGVEYLVNTCNHVSIKVSHIITKLGNMEDIQLLQKSRAVKEEEIDEKLETFFSKKQDEENFHI